MLLLLLLISSSFLRFLCAGAIPLLEVRSFVAPHMISSPNSFSVSLLGYSNDNGAGIDNTDNDDGNEKKDYHVDDKEIDNIDDDNDT